MHINKSIFNKRPPKNSKLLVNANQYNLDQKIKDLDKKIKECRKESNLQSHKIGSIMSINN